MYSVPLSKAGNFGARLARRASEAFAALERHGHTYRSDGSIYFKIATFDGYGKLARLDHDGIQPGARIDSDSYAKDDARDFVLWKARKEGEHYWDSPLGAGRPGWRWTWAIRCCSASTRSACSFRQISRSGM